jgi:hypothetical protein
MYKEVKTQCAYRTKDIMPLGFLYTHAFVRAIRYIAGSFLLIGLTLSVRYFLTMSHLSKLSFQISGNILERPEFFSVSPQGLNYHVKAEKVVQKCDQGYDFSSPAVTVQGKQNIDLYGKGKHGFYEGKEKVFALEGNVEVSNGAQYYVQTPGALMYFTLKKVAGAQDVQGRCPYGQFWGKGFVLKKDSLVLKGPCRIRLTALK